MTLIHSAHHPASEIHFCTFLCGLQSSAQGFGFCSAAINVGLRPNNSFKPTPHRGVNSVLCATLHAVATPLRGGLTQALAAQGSLR